MTGNTSPPFSQYPENIRKSGLTIYDPIEVGDPDLWIPSAALESLLNIALAGLDVSGLALRTRSKIVKTAVCKALGYPVPKSFRRTRPRFPGQMFDTYSQQRKNLQVWNDPLAPTRRYVVIRVSPDNRVDRVKVVTGERLGKLDRTGKLTQKYQARLKCGAEAAELITPEDTDTLKLLLNPDLDIREISPTEDPCPGTLLPIRELFDRLRPLQGTSFPDSGRVQERRRGADVHRLVCHALGYSSYADDGQFPDVRQQLLEVKVQTSPTIDLGLVSPDSQAPLVDVPRVSGRQVRHCDVRYVLFHRDHGRHNRHPYPHLSKNRAGIPYTVPAVPRENPE